MTFYHDQLWFSKGENIASIVGCGLDRLERPITGFEIESAIRFYAEYKASIDKFPIGARRQIICNFTREGKKPSYVNPPD